MNTTTPNSGGQALYRHAMIEAGCVLDASEDKGGKPYDPCPVCGHSFSKEGQGG